MLAMDGRTWKEHDAGTEEWVRKRMKVLVTPTFAILKVLVGWDMLQ